MGLLGTVVGIIGAFAGIGAAGQRGMGTVMAGISEALIETAFGLMVAIPAVIAFNYAERRDLRDRDRARRAPPASCWTSSRTTWAAPPPSAKSTPRSRARRSRSKESNMGVALGGKKGKGAQPRHQHHPAGRRGVGAAHHLHGGRRPPSTRARRSSCPRC